MSTLHRVYCDPNFPNRTRAEMLDRRLLAPLGQAISPASDGCLSFVEAVAWVATRDLATVAGVKPFKLNEMNSMRRCFTSGGYFPRDPNLERVTRMDDDWVSSALADDIAAAYCSCDRKPWSDCDKEDWDKLTPAEQKLAADDPAAPHRMCFLGVHSERCRCPDFAARSLISAAAIGRLTGRHIVNGRSLKMERIVWDHADFHFHGGLKFRDFEAAGVTFAWRDLRRVWPEGAKPDIVGDGRAPLFTPQPGKARTALSRRRRGRPSAGDAIVTIYKQLSAQLGWHRPSIRAASRLCVAEAKRQKIGDLGLPRSYEQYLSPFWPKNAARIKNKR